MQPDFWHDRWTRHQIGFHESAVNPLLVEHFPSLGRLEPGSRVFVPLCGKTLDIDWLLARGLEVVGVELSPIAVAELHERVGHPPGLRVIVGDFFALTAGQIGAIDVVYDRAALIALPAEMRRRYVAHLKAITASAPQLLVTLDYEPAVAEGPPFAVTDEEVRVHYDDFKCERVATHQTLLKGRFPAVETVWRLRPRPLSSS